MDNQKLSEKVDYKYELAQKRRDKLNFIDLENSLSMIYKIEKLNTNSSFKINFEYIAEKKGVKLRIGIYILIFPEFTYAGCENGDCHNGYGTYIWFNGDTDDRSWAHGDKFIGYFKNGKEDGMHKNWDEHWDTCWDADWMHGEIVKKMVVTVVMKIPINIVIKRWDETLG